MAGKRQKQEGLASTLHKKPMPMPDNLKEHFIRRMDTDSRVKWYHKNSRGNKGELVEKALARDLEQRYQRWLTETREINRAQSTDDQDTEIVGRIMNGGFHYKRDEGGLWWTDKDQWVSDMLKTNLERKWIAAGRPTQYQQTPAPQASDTKKSTGS